MRGAVHEWSSFDICAYKPHFRFDLQGWSRSKRPGLTVHPGGPRLRPGARRVLVSEIGLRVYSFRHESLLTFDGGGGANDNKFISSNWRGRQDTAWTTSTNTITETTQETGTKRDAQESYSRKRTSQVFAQQPARPRADINGLDRRGKTGNRGMTRDALAASRRIGLRIALRHTTLNLRAHQRPSYSTTSDDTTFKFPQRTTGDPFQHCVGYDR